MFKACSRCGKIHDSRFKCNAGKTYAKAEERELRSTYRWTKKSREMRENAQYLCEVCRDQGQYTYEDLEVHHIEKIREDKSKLLDDDNLIVLCIRHHKDADAGRLSKDYLKELVKRREK